MAQWRQHPKAQRTHKTPSKPNKNEIITKILTRTATTTLVLPTDAWHLVCHAATSGCIPNICQDNKSTCPNVRPSSGATRGGTQHLPPPRQRVPQRAAKVPATCTWAPVPTTPTRARSLCMLLMRCPVHRVLRPRARPLSSGARRHQLPMQLPRWPAGQQATAVPMQLPRQLPMQLPSSCSVAPTLAPAPRLV